MALTYRQRVSLLEDLQAEAARAKALVHELLEFIEQHMARIENARWGDNPTETRRDRWVKAKDAAPYKDGNK